MVVIVSWNVNGIRAVLKKGFLDWFNSSGFDILCLQETKAFYNQLEDNLSSPDGYYVYWHNGDRKGYAGVAIYSRFKANYVNYEFNVVPEIFKNDGRVLELHFNDFILLNIYFPNGNPRKGMQDMLDEKLNFYKCFLEHIKFLEKIGKPIICLGDYNIAHTSIDLARPKENEDSIGFLPVERQWITRIIENGYVDVFRFLNPDKKDSYTWWSYRTRARDRNVGWRIDYCFVSCCLKKNLQSLIHENNVLGSDHCPLRLELDF